MVPRDRVSLLLFVLVMLMGGLVLLMVGAVYVDRGDFLALDTGSALIDQLRISVSGLSDEPASEPSQGEVKGVSDISEMTAEDLGFIDYPVVTIEDTASILAEPNQS